VASITKAAGAIGTSARTSEGYAMMDYRCYHLNPVGRFIAVEVYQCSTDAEACDRAHDMWQTSNGAPSSYGS